MARSTVATALSLLSLASALDTRHFPGASTGPGYVHLPVTAHRRDDGVLQRRDVSGITNVEMPNFKLAWVVNIAIGDPGQQTAVTLDTGSTELWVNPDCSSASRIPKGANDNDDNIVYVDDPLSDPKLCEQRGRYDPSKSSGSKKSDLESEEFHYGDFTAVAVDYFQDKISIGGVAIENQIFGVASASNQTGIGIMGMGPPHSGFNSTDKYPLILSTMAQQGVIKSPAFSLDLRDYDNATGSIVFGGIDKGKYAGSLTKIPFLTVEQNYQGQKFNNTSYWVKVKSMAFTAPGTKDKTELKIPGGSYVSGLDCGSSNMLLPDGMATEICTRLNGKPLPDQVGGCIVDCSLREKSGGINVGLEGTDILVTYQNIISKQTYGQSTTCVVLAADSKVVSDPPTYLLGAPFLRSSYAVFDWGNGNLHIAQAANCGSNLVAIGSGVDAVPNQKGDCSLAVKFAASYGLMIVGALFSSAMLL